MKYTKEILEEAVKNCYSVSAVLRFFDKSVSGGSHALISNKIKQFGINTSHFRHTTGGTSRRKNYNEILVLDRNQGRKEDSKLLRRSLLESGRKYQCSKCGISTWNNQQLVLEIHHINEDNLDNRKTNLEFLCPNCHSQAHMNMEAKTKYMPNVCVDCQSKCYGNRCNKCGKKKKRDTALSKMPTKNQLIKDFQELKTFVTVGKKYNITDNSLRRWCAIQGLPSSKPEMLKIITAD